MPGFKVRGHVECCRICLAESAWFVDEDENKCTQATEVLWRKRDGADTLWRWESYGHLSQGDSAQPLPGQAFTVSLGSYIKEGFIIYYIECCCLHFRYNQGNKNNKCRRGRGWADYALSLGKFIQALGITLKIGNKHVLFQTRAREF